jgi:hypothetical protein
MKIEDRENPNFEFMSSLDLNQEMSKNLS